MGNGGMKGKGQDKEHVERTHGQGQRGRGGGLNVRGRVGRAGESDGGKWGPL